MFMLLTLLSRGGSALAIFGANERILLTRHVCEGEGQCVQSSSVCVRACLQLAVGEKTERESQLVSILWKVSILQEISIETVLNIQYRYVSILRYF